MKSNGSQKRSKIPIATQEGEIHLQGPESSVEIVAEAEGSWDLTGQEPHPALTEVVVAVSPL